MANFNGVIFTANHRLADNFSVLANYTYSHCLSNLNYTGDDTPPAKDPNNHAAEYGSCNFDTMHNLTISGVFITPAFKQHSLNYAAGGWQVSPLITYRTGMPYTVTDGTDNSLTTIGQDRPNLVPGVNLYSKNFYPAAGLKPQWLNAAAYTLSPLGTFGNERPFQARGPGFAHPASCRSARLLRHARRGLHLRQY